MSFFIVSMRTQQANKQKKNQETQENTSFVLQETRLYGAAVGLKHHYFVNAEVEKSLNPVETTTQ